MTGESLNVEKRFYIRLPKMAVHKFHEMPPVVAGAERTAVRRLPASITGATSVQVRVSPGAHPGFWSRGPAEF